MCFVDCLIPQTKVIAPGVVSAEMQNYFPNMTKESNGNFDAGIKEILSVSKPPENHPGREELPKKPEIGSPAAKGRIPKWIESLIRLIGAGTLLYLLFRFASNVASRQF